MLAVMLVISDVLISRPLQMLSSLCVHTTKVSATESDFTYCYSLPHMRPDLQKPGIIAHTKICSIMHYKNLVQKTYFIKNLTKAVTWPC